MYMCVCIGLGGAKAGAIKGYSQELERPYLRAHFAPATHSQKSFFILAVHSKYTRTVTFQNLCQDPATVRPADVLVRALALVKQKWYANVNRSLLLLIGLFPGLF